MVQEWRCRLIAQELAYGQRMDELFAGTHSVMAVKLILLHGAKEEARARYHVRGREVYYLVREDPPAGLHQAAPTRPPLKRWIRGGNLAQSHVRHPRCSSDLAKRKPERP